MTCSECWKYIMWMISECWSPGQLKQSAGWSYDAADKSSVTLHGGESNNINNISADFSGYACSCVCIRLWGPVFVCKGYLPRLMQLICCATNGSIEDNLHNKFTSSRGQQREGRTWHCSMNSWHSVLPYALTLRMHTLHLTLLHSQHKNDHGLSLGGEDDVGHSDTAGERC